MSATDTYIENALTRIERTLDEFDNRVAAWTAVETEDPARDQGGV